MRRISVSQDRQEQCFSCGHALLGGSEERILTVTEIVERMGIPESGTFTKKGQAKWAGKALKRLALFVKYEGKGESGRHRYRFRRERIESIAGRYNVDGLDGIDGSIVAGRQSTGDHEQHCHGGYGARQPQDGQNQQNHEAGRDGRRKTVDAQGFNHDTNKIIPYDDVLNSDPRAEELKNTILEARKARERQTTQGSASGGRGSCEALKS